MLALYGGQMEKKEILKPLIGIRGLGAIVIAYFFHYNHFIEREMSPM